MQHFEILGNKVTSITLKQLNDEVRSIIFQNGKELILNTNVHGINLAQRYPWLKKFRNEAKIVHCDGAGVQLGLRILGVKIPSRITVHDWMQSLAELCVTHCFSIYFLGATPGLAQRAATNLCEIHPGLRIVGTHHGYFEKKGAESQAVVASINQLSPDILIVGFGMPIQEEWIKDNWGQIDAHVFLAGGGCFDVFSGGLPTCPRIFADHGLEWFFRFMTEPRRLFTRYIVGNPIFIFRVMLQRLGLVKHGAPSVDNLRG